MPEVTVEIKNHLVKYACPKCHSFMVWGGIELTSNPPVFPHTCPKCGLVENLRRTYPYQTYTEIKKKKSITNNK